MKSLISTYIQNWQVNTARTFLSGPAILLAFFFVSCEEAIEVEGDLVPGGNSTEIRFVEIPLEMNHTAFDSLIVSTNAVAGSRGQIFVGKQNDPLIGDFSASGYFGLLLDNDFRRDSIPSNASVTQTRLKLGFNYYYGSQFTSGQNFVVNQLADTLAINGGSYGIYDEIPLDEMLSLDEEIIVSPIDTLDHFIPMRNDLGNEIISLIQDTDNSSVDIYNALKGFKIELGSDLNNIQGINLADGESYLEVIYESPELDTLGSVQLSLSGSSFTQVDFQPGSMIPMNYSGKEEFELADDSKAYFNNMLGISPKVKLSNYLTFLDTVEFMQINRAELVISSPDFVLEENQTNQIRPASNIIPYILGEDGNIEKQGEDFWAFQANFGSGGAPVNPNGASTPIALSYDEGKKEIKGDISFFLQEIYNNPGLWNPDYDFIFTGQFIRRNSTPFNEVPKINLGNFDHFFVDKENIKIRIYYTTFK
ncbi:DUF4270 family protein [Marivirga arenosa]|uniref:DUF4270 family protein n=1 Tax=Marivirga arenosa TaxID=3059076 RepID=A0AA49GL65_9BACT|nr:DUF4270 family protein [Marivirga sp. ABR2-2]WKK86024.2 DUF4270 family protein [Marivirga sp. ABR2-2]